MMQALSDLYETAPGCQLITASTTVRSSTTTVQVRHLDRVRRWKKKAVTP